MGIFVLVWVWGFFCLVCFFKGRFEVSKIEKKPCQIDKR